MARTARWLCPLGALLLLSGPLAARPAHKQALADYFGPLLPKKLNDCRTCHLPDPAGKDAKDPEEKPHNAFGGRLHAVRDELRKAGKKTTIADRLDAILQEDADGDGITNLLEILLGRFPGDKADRPTAQEFAAVQPLVTAFQKFRASYPWRPFEIVKQPAVPAIKDLGWVRNPLDAFIAAGHEENGLTPRPEAPRHVLLRRIYVDLLGLPPTRDELQAFQNDPSADAYERVVDRLLASPQYGERWGRHWMDVWRYSDWAGFGAQVRDSQPHVWHWRDWIIDSLNEDKGYDRMVQEMLAGDEMAPDNPDILRATGYLVRNYKLLSREKWMQDTVEHTAMAFLGVTLGCAKCHDHMYDPVTQKEYYQFRAIFEPHNVRTDRLPGQPDVQKNGVVRAFDADLTAKTFLLVRGDDRAPDKTPLVPGVLEALGGSFGPIQTVTYALTARCPDKRPFVIEETRAASAAAAAKARDALDKARQKKEPLESRQQESDLADALHAALEAVLQAEALEDGGQRGTREWTQAARSAVDAQRRAAHLEAQRKLHAAKQARPAPGAKMDAAKKAAAEKAVAEAEKALVQAEVALRTPLTTNYTPRAVKTFPATSTGRRLALARWITSTDNPLAARVAVNHIWLRHFGQALAPSVFDFGRNGRPPSHPALLDWLAADFMDHGWSMKHLHRLIVTSATYRQDSTPDAQALAVDRDNKFLWRMAPRRVEAEVVRDSLLSVAGSLDRAMSGPDIDYPLGLKVPRRSLYFRHAAEKQMEFLQLFDAASVSECYERKQAIVPQQALALFNSELARQQSRLLATKLTAEYGQDTDRFITAAFQQVLTRDPTPQEKEECVRFLRDEAMRHQKAQPPVANAELAARASLAHVLLNHHEFVTMR